MVWVFKNDDQNQCQEKVQAATEQNHQKETLSIDQKIKKKRLKKTRNNNLLMINNKLILYKNEAKGFWNYLRNKKKIKNVKMKKLILNIWNLKYLKWRKILWQIKNLNLLLHNQLIKIIFQTKMTQNLKKMKTTQEVRYHKGNIWLIKHKKYG